jgi:hypothetical protein
LESNPSKQRKYIDFTGHYANLSEAEVMAYQQHYLVIAEEFIGLVQLLREKLK